VAVDPIAKFRRWMADAARAGTDLPESIALATADERGRPSVRYVLLKSAEPGGFVFYTNRESRKGRDLARNPRAALAVYWHATGKQARVEGHVEQVTRREADAYWAERPPASRIASAASSQSRALGSRADLMREVRRLQQQYPNGDPPRPPHWTGYRLIPDEIEFWTRREPRLHHRELFVRRGRSWKRTLLQP
jgi:pyridoxamine 5'-phosphate oxidase